MNLRAAAFLGVLGLLLVSNWLGPVAVGEAADGAVELYAGDLLSPEDGAAGSPVPFGPVPVLFRISLPALVTSRCPGATPLVLPPARAPPHSLFS